MSARPRDGDPLRGTNESTRPKLGWIGGHCSVEQREALLGSKAPQLLGGRTSLGHLETDRLAGGCRQEVVLVRVDPWKRRQE